MMLLLFLLQLVVEGLELATLIALSACKHRIDILAKRDFWTESVHLLVIVRVARHAKVLNRAFGLLAAGREFVEVGGILTAGRSIAFSDRIPLHLVNASSD